MESYLVLVEDFDALDSLAGLCVFLRRHALPCSVVPELGVARPTDWDAGVTVALPHPIPHGNTAAILRLVIQGWTVAELEINAALSSQAERGQGSARAVDEQLAYEDDVWGDER